MHRMISLKPSLDAFNSFLVASDGDEADDGDDDGDDDDNGDDDDDDDATTSGSVSAHYFSATISPGMQMH